MSTYTELCPLCGEDEGYQLDAEIHPRYTLAQCQWCESQIPVEVDVDQDGDHVHVYASPLGFVERLGVAL